MDTNTMYSPMFPHHIRFSILQYCMFPSDKHLCCITHTKNEQQSITPNFLESGVGQYQPLARPSEAVFTDMVLPTESEDSKECTTRGEDLTQVMMEPVRWLDGAWSSQSW